MKDKQNNGTSKDVTITITIAELETVIKTLNANIIHTELAEKIIAQRAEFQVGQKVVDRTGVLGTVVKANYDDDDQVYHPHPHVDVEREDGYVSGEGLTYFIYDAKSIAPVVPDLAETTN